MATDPKGVLAVFGAAILGGLAMYFSQFLTAGPSPEAVQAMQVQRELISIVFVGLAAVVGYGVFSGDEIRDSVTVNLVVCLLAGIIGYGIGFAALWLAPPEGFTLGSKALTFTLVFLQEVVPFTLAGFAGTVVRALE